MHPTRRALLTEVRRLESATIDQHGRWVPSLSRYAAWCAASIQLDRWDMAHAPTPRERSAAKRRIQMACRG